MEGAKIAIFEDNESVRSVIRIRLFGSAHTVAHEATSLAESMSLIETMEEGDIDLALVDANYSGSIEDGSEGELIASILRNKFKNLVIVGISGTRPIPSAHYNVDKVEFVLKVGQIIDELPDTAPA